MGKTIRRVYSVSGNTYPNKELLNRNGLKFDKANKVWKTTDKSSADRVTNQTYAGRKAGREMRSSRFAVKVNKQRSMSALRHAVSARAGRSTGS